MLIYLHNLSLLLFLKAQSHCAVGQRSTGTRGKHMFGEPVTLQQHVGKHVVGRRHASPSQGSEYMFISCSRTELPNCFGNGTDS